MPGVVAYFGFPSGWRRAWIVMLLTMVVDADHLLATPIFDPHRCGIAFHPLHSWWAIVIYVGMLVLPTTRLLGCGLVIHMGLDAVDCVWMALE